jgi:hydroxymethylbilane synthase
MFNTSKKITIGSRKSSLARRQVEIFKNFFFQKYKNLKKDLFKEIYLTTQGDQILDKKLSEVGNKGLFTKEIDQAQLEHKIDISIHSLKDLPYKLPKGLFICAYLKREDYRDAIVSRSNLSLSKLNKGSVIGTSSIRREIQLKKVRPDLKIKIIRGNVETRIKKVLDGEYDATLLAMAGLNRLDIKKNIRPLSSKEFIPAPGQGIIAIVVREDDKEIIKPLNEISDKQTDIQAICERSFMYGLDGSCQTPLGALALLLDKKRVNFSFFASNSNGSILKTGKKIILIENAKKECFELGKKIREMLY